MPCRILMLYCIVASTVNACSKYTGRELNLKIGESCNICLEISSNFENCTECMTIIPQYPDVVQVQKTTFNGTTNSTSLYLVNIVAMSAGKSVLLAKCGLVNRNYGLEYMLLVRVHHSNVVKWISVVVGWLYFLAWGSCTYPQVVKNFVKKSVVGLNFDYVLFSMIGHIVYTIFNAGMVFLTPIKLQYKERYPRGIEPVRINDLFFSLHGICITLIATSQCLIYKTSGQSISVIAKVIVTIYLLSAFTVIILALIDVIWWLDVLYLCSYIKLYGTIIKYIPQAYMNYKLKSTKGFSILGVLLDFLGSTLSITQIFLDGYNYDDWRAFEENPTKCGLGIISFSFSSFFFFQRFCLYRKKSVKNQSISLDCNTANIALHI